MIIGQISSILIGSPAGDQTQTKTAHYLGALLMQSIQAGLRVGHGPSIGTYPCMGQNAFVAALIEQKADALLLVDADMEFPPDILLRLLARNKAIVGCAYRSRQEPHGVMARHLAGTPATGAETGCLEMSHVPSGMLLVRRSVLSTMKYPYFFVTYGNALNEFTTGDVNFCQEARRLGHKVWCDFDASANVRHIGQSSIGWKL